MFLPVLLVRDYGIGGWVVFAIPNIVGAAGMAWVLRRPGSSDLILAEHRTACVAFSIVTLTFHAFFLIWLVGAVIPLSFCLTAIALVLVLTQFRPKDRAIDLILSWVVLGVSLVILAKGLTNFHIADHHHPEQTGDLLYLTPICFFGFLLCPYLDVTFLEARAANTPGGAKVAFGVGFGLFFLAMIFLPLLYVGDFVRWGDIDDGSFGESGLRTWVALFLICQTGFTWAAHRRALPAYQKSDLLMWIGAVAAVAGVTFLLKRPASFNTLDSNSRLGEPIYRIFVSFYGLVFPAYVWICMTPIKGRSPGASRMALIVWAAAVVIAAPMYWMAFLDGKMAWLAPALIVVLGMRGLVSIGNSSNYRPRPAS